MSIVIQGQDRVDSKLTAIVNRWQRDTHDILNQAAGLLYASVQLNFEQGGRPNPWARRVSNADGNFSRPDKKTHPILIKSGRLMRAAIGQGESIYREDHKDGKHSVEVGVDATAIPYAWAQQKGYRLRNLCARPYFMLQDDDREKIQQLIYDWYTQDL